MEKFSSFDISKILNIPRDRIQDWLKRGFISPSIEKASGQGTKNLFSRWDVYGIEIFHRIVNSGTSREWAKKLFDYWQKETAKLNIEEAKKLKSIVYAFHPTLENIKGETQVEEGIMEVYSILNEDDEDNVIKIDIRDEEGNVIASRVHCGFFTDTRIINLSYIIKNVDGSIEEFFEEQN